MIGIFDSGIGGLTVVKELLQRAPRVAFAYLGDTARAPYGNKSADVIIQYATEDVAFLVGRGATDIIVACNTVSSVALDALRAAFPRVRFFDVISPAVEKARERAGDMQTLKIGVIGTRATIGSGVYEKQIKEWLPDAEVVSVACPLFVPLVEEDWVAQPETKRIVRRSLARIRQQRVDMLILGCTHYPLLLPAIRASLQRRVAIIDSPSAVLDHIAKNAPELLREEGVQSYYFSDASPHTDRIATRWLGKTIHGERATLG